MPESSPRPKQRRPAKGFFIPDGVVEGEWKIRPREDRNEKKHRLWKDARSFWIKEASVYLFALLMLSTTAVYCFWVLFSPASSQEDRHWVMSILQSLLVGIIGYVFGKAAP